MIYDPLTIEPPKTGGVTTIKELNKLLRKVKVQDLLGCEPDENGIYQLEVTNPRGSNRMRLFCPKDYNKKQPHLRMTKGGERRGWHYVTGERYSVCWWDPFDLYARDGIIEQVRYSKELPSLQGWTRSVLDPAIPNNFDETWVTKTFKFLVAKATFTYEPVECEGTTLNGAMENYCQQNPEVRYGLGTGNRLTRHINFLEDQSFVCEAPVEDQEEAA